MRMIMISIRKKEFIIQKLWQNTPFLLIIPLYNLGNIIEL